MHIANKIANNIANNIVNNIANNMPKLICLSHHLVHTVFSSSIGPYKSYAKLSLVG